MGQLVFQAALGGAVNLIGPNISATTNFTLPGADGTNGQALTTNGSGVLGFSSIVSGAAGSNTQVQFNSGGNFGASANLTWDGTNLTSTGFSGPHNGTVGATTANTGNFTTLTTSSTVTLNGGTANGVTYLNGSKVLTSGSALTFDGTTFKVAKAGGVFGPTNLVYVDVTSSYGGVTLNSASGQNCFFELYQGGTTKVGEFGIDAANSLVNIGGFGSYNTRFYASGSEGMRLTSTGLGIGTSSPFYRLSVRQAAFGVIGEFRTIDGTNNPGLEIKTSAAGTTLSQVYSSGTTANLLFETNSAERMRLDSAGNLGLGVTPSAWSTSKAIQVGSTAALFSYNNVTTDVGSNVYYDGASYKYITTNSASFARQTSGGHSWYTAASGTAGTAISFTQAMTLDASGDFLVGQTAVQFENSNSTSFYKASGYWIVNHANGTSSGVRYTGFAYNGTEIGSITQSGTTAVLYNITSDQRLKENIQDADSASSLIDSLQVRQFDWKADGNHQRYGFVAQELVTVAPEAVHQPVDTEEMMAVDYSKLVPMLVKEIQSLRQRVAQLETN